MAEKRGVKWNMRSIYQKEDGWLPIVDSLQRFRP